MTARTARWVMLLGLLGCSESPTHAGPPTVRVRLVVDASPATAVLLRIAGPMPSEVEGVGTDVIVEARAVSNRWVIAAFGAPDLAGPIAELRGVPLEDAYLLDARVLEAIGADNLPLDPATVTARIVVDTLR